MKLICKTLGGSHSYGLNTPESDIDYRGVFMNTTYQQILGMEEHKHQKEETDDIMYYELRRFVELLRNGNTGALEILFNKNWLEFDPLFKLRFCDNALRFLDSEKLYKCLKGYAQHELRLAMGLRPGDIGHKRCEAVKKYGFSPKNFCQLFRLLIVGRIFFERDQFIVNCQDFHPFDFEFLLDVKTHPENWTVGRLRELYNVHEKQLDAAYVGRTVTHKFDNGYANEMIFKTYAPTLMSQYFEVIK